MNLSVISYAIAAAIGFGAAWTLHGRAIDSLKLEKKDERIARDYAARAAIERSTSAVIKAQNGAAARVAVLRADADGARGSLVGLRSSADAALRTASSSLDACNRVAAAQNIVVAASAEFIQNVSSDADQCHSDLTLMREACKQGFE